MNNDRLLSHLQKNIIIALLAITVGVSFLPQVKVWQENRNKQAVRQVLGNYASLVQSGVDKQTALDDLSRSLRELSARKQLQASSASADYPSMQESMRFCATLFDMIMPAYRESGFDTAMAVYGWYLDECHQVPNGKHDEGILSE